MNRLHTRDLTLGKAEEELDPNCTGNFRSQAENQDSGDAKSNLVYVTGTVGIDYGSEERKNAFEHILGANNVHDAKKVLEYLRREKITPDTLIWTLNQDSLPIYAISPYCAFTSETFKKMSDVLQKQLSQRVELVSVAGKIKGNAKLLSGTEVPVIIPDPAGIFSWSTVEMKLKVLGPPPREPGMEQTLYDKKWTTVASFLDIAFYKMQNKGNTPKDRALNFAATNAFRIKEAFEKAHGERLVLQSIDVNKKPFSPRDSDYWEVQLKYFDPDPASRMTQAPKVFSFTIDIAPVIPLRVGKMIERRL